MTARLFKPSSLFFFLLLLSSYIQAARLVIPAPPSLSAKAYILIDADSGKVIVEHRADEMLPPASLTKMLTSYILSYELNTGNVKEDDQVLVSKQAWAKNFPGSSLMWIEVGKRVSLKDLHRGVIISSGNDASVAVAEHIAGSEDAFADVMNQHAQLLGMNNSHFVNAHGLPHVDHYTTARDLTLLAKAIINDFPDDYKLYKEKEFTYNNIRQTNRNTLLWQDPSVDGLKTGHTKEAGYCIVVSAKRQGMRLISVVMGTKSQAARKVDTQKLLSYGFRYFQTYPLYKAGEVLEHYRVWGGKQEQIKLGLKDALSLTVPKGKQGEVKAELRVDSVLRAPLKKGDKVGMVVFMLGRDVLEEHPLVALEGVEEAGVFSRLWDDLILFFQSLIP